MMKVLFPIILILALELVPVVKTYANIKDKYGDHLNHLTPYAQNADASLTSAFADKFSELEQNVGAAKQASLGYRF